MDEPEFLLKIVIVGDSSVGKTCLLNQFCQNRFNSTTKPTIGIDYLTYDTSVDNKKVTVHFWDTAGQEKFRGLTTAYYKNCHGMILVYDIANRKTFDNLTRWLTEIETYAQKTTKTILVGNKCDLEETRQVSILEGTTLGEQKGMKFFEMSPKVNYDGRVQRVILELIEEVVRAIPTESADELGAIGLRNKTVEHFSDSKLPEESKLRTCCS